MYLKNKVTVTSEYTGKSKFDFWHDIKIGDSLEISMKLEPTGQNRGKIYAPTIKAYNQRTGESFSDSINSFQNYLGKIKYA